MLPWLEGGRVSTQERRVLTHVGTLDLRVQTGTRAQRRGRNVVAHSVSSIWGASGLRPNWRLTQMA